MEQKVCIIIPVNSISSKFEACIISLFNLNYSNFDVIIIDDSKDGNLKIPMGNHNSRIKVLYSHAKGPSYARNLAVKNTDAGLVAFTDSDCIVDADWLKELLSGLEMFPQGAACGGIQMIPEDAADFEKKVFLFMQRIGFITDYIRNSRKENIISVVHNASCCVIYRRDILLKEDGFLEGLWPGEDVELDYRLKQKGYNLYFNSKAKVYHYRPKNLKEFSKMMYRYGISCGILTKMYGIFRKIQVLPILVLAAGVSLSSAFVFRFVPEFLMVLGVIFLLLLLYVRLKLTIFFLCCIACFFWNIGFANGISSGRKK